MKDETIIKKIEELVSENLDQLNGDRSYGDDTSAARKQCVTETLQFLEILNQDELHKMEFADKESKINLEKAKMMDAGSLERMKLNDNWRKVIELSKTCVPAAVGVATLVAWLIRTGQMIYLNEHGTCSTRTSLENLSFPKLWK